MSSTSSPPCGSAIPDLVISVDTWRAEVGEAVAEAGADLLNDTWGGVDPRLAEVAAAYGIGLVCAHAGGLRPAHPPASRSATRTWSPTSSRHVTAEAERAAALGVRRDAILVDPAHDFGKNTWHSLEVTRRLGELTATGWPVLVAVSNKDFIGETLGQPVEKRGVGTMAVLGSCRRRVCASTTRRVPAARTTSPRSPPQPLIGPCDRTLRSAQRAAEGFALPGPVGRDVHAVAARTAVAVAAAAIAGQVDQHP